LNGDDKQLWEKINNMGEVLAVLRSEVVAIHKRLDEWNDGGVTIKTCEIITRNNGLRMDDHEARIKALEHKSADTPARVLWLLFATAASSIISLGIAGKL
jgi:hypothetical protein